MLTAANRLSVPVVAAWGMGVDSTAMIIEWVARGLPLSVVLTADIGTEREETYAFLPLFQQWMDAHGIEHHVLRYVPQRFKHWPPYFTLLENCLANATLPSISILQSEVEDPGAGPVGGSLEADAGLLEQ